MSNTFKILFLISHFTIPLLGQKEVEISNKTERYDSSRINIYRMYYSSGRLCYENYTDSIKKLRLEKYYNSNGSLKMEGDKYIENNYHVGIWKYYSKNGKIKKINFDSTSQISYYQAIQIAKIYGYQEPKIEITENVIKDNYYWKIEYWKEDYGDHSTGEYILIKRSDGKVTKPKNNHIVRYD